MAAEGDDTPRSIIFTGMEDVYNFAPFEGWGGRPSFLLMPRDATRYCTHESVTVIRRELFSNHPKIIELICHAGVEKIEQRAFWCCYSLQRAIIPGVKELEVAAFLNSSLTYVECTSLEIIRAAAFDSCKSLSDINLPSAKVVAGNAFKLCRALTEAKFGKNLESIGEAAFISCTSLERITIPLKNGLFTHDNVFTACENLNHVDLAEGAVLQETINLYYLTNGEMT